MLNLRNRYESTNSYNMNCTNSGSEELPRQSEFHVGPGPLWSCETSLYDGNCFWWPFLGQERLDHSSLGEVMAFCSAIAPNLICRICRNL